jgi:hypothetical protein
LLKNQSNNYEASTKVSSNFIHQRREATSFISFHVIISEIFHCSIGDAEESSRGGKFLPERSDEGSCEGNRGPLVAVDMAAVLVELLVAVDMASLLGAAALPAGIGKRN